MRHSVLAILAAAVLLAAGCRESDGDRAVTAVRDLLGALERQDGAAACDRLTEAGVSELLLVALRSGVSGAGLQAATVDRCATVARRLTEQAPRLAELGELRESSVSRRLLEGDRATIETRAGAYELEEVEGHWRISRFEPLARVLTGGRASERPVGLVLVAPRLSDPALGPELRGRTTRESIELTGTLEPGDAGLRVESSPGTRVTLAEARHGRFLVTVGLSRGHNEIVLIGEAPDRATSELAVKLTRR